MKSSFALLAASLAFASVAKSTDVPVTFTLAVDPSGVALQFDVVGSVPVESVGPPEFVGASNHSVESATLASGVHRFVVYSLDGAPISSTGTVTVSFAASFPLEDGVLSISNVTASNASGVAVEAAPNALPTLTETPRPHRSIEADETLQLVGLAVDLDGALTNLALYSGQSQVASDQTAPFALAWGPLPAGSHTLSLWATDDRAQTATFELGTVRAFAKSDITDYASFASVHFGASASGDAIALSGDPYGIGIRNGIAYLLGLNPHSPDFSKLPRVKVEATGDGADMVVNFSRRADLGSLQWRARHSSDLSAFASVDAAAIVESDAVDGMKAVEIRLPLDSPEPTPRFVDLGVAPGQ